MKSIFDALSVRLDCWKNHGCCQRPHLFPICQTFQRNTGFTRHNHKFCLKHVNWKSKPIDFQPNLCHLGPQPLLLLLPLQQMPVLKQLPASPNLHQITSLAMELSPMLSLLNPSLFHKICSFCISDLKSKYRLVILLIRYYVRIVLKPVLQFQKK